MKRNFVFVFILASFFTTNLFGQCPPNINFEFGNLSNWQCFIGSGLTGTGTGTGCNPGTLTVSYVNWGPTNGPIPPFSGQHVITSGAGFDPYFLLGPTPMNVPIVCPYILGNTSSLRLGNDRVNDTTAMVRYYLTIPANKLHYTFIYWYALVLDKPSLSCASNHTIAEMPRFTVRSYDAATGQRVTCDTSTFVIGTAMPGFTKHYTTSDTFMCKDWSAALLNFRNLAGHTIVIEFSAADCTPSGHFGYAYVDFESCSSSTIKMANCAGSNIDTIIAPPGFQSYVWYDSTFTNVLGSSDTLYMPAPNHRIPIHLAVFPYPGFGCADTVADTIFVPQPPVAQMAFVDSLCPGFPFQFTDASYTNSLGQYISGWKWDFGDPASGAANTSTVQNPTHVYNVVGNYTVTLIAQTNLRCYSDTVKKIVHIANKNFVFATGSTSICLGATVPITASATGSVPPAIIPCGLNTTGGCSGTASSAQVGVGTNTNSSYSVFDNTNYNGKTFLRYEAVGLQAALGTGPKVITSMQLNVITKQSFYPFRGLTIKISCIPSSTPYWTGGSGSFPATSGVIVYNNVAGYNTVSGWNMFTFSNGYNWDGVSDLLIEFCFANGAFQSNIDILQSATTANVTAMYGGNAAATPVGCNITNGTANNILPNAKFGYCSMPLTAGAYNYQWEANPSSPNSFSGGSPFGSNLLVTPVKNTTYVVHLIGTTPCIVTDTVKIQTISSFGSIHSPNDTVCKGDTIRLFSDSNTPANIITKWKWTSKYGTTISCDTCRMPLFTIMGKDTFIVKISLASGCSRFDTIAIDTFPKIIADFAMSRNSICSKDTMVVHFTGKTFPTIGLANYHWNFSNPIKIGWGANKDYDTVSWLNNTIAPVVKNISLSVTQGACKSDTVTKQVTIHIIPKAHITAADTEFCAGSQITVSSSGSVTENPNAATYIWHSSPLQSTPGVITGQGPNTITFNYPYVKTANVYEYLQIIENGCVSPLDSTLLLVHPVPFSSFNSTPNPVCSGDRVYFDFTGVIDTTYSNVHTLTWGFTGGSPSFIASSTKDTASAVFYNTNSYPVNDLVTLSVKHNNCQSPPYNFLVVVNPNPLPVIVGPRDICAGQVANLVTQVKYKTYNWTDVFGIVTHNDTLKIKQNETVSLNVIDFNGCIGNAASASISVHPNPHADAGTGQIIFLGNSVMLDASNSFGGDTYAWTPASSLNNSQVMQPTATPLVTTTYLLAYTNSQVGCVDYDTLIIDVKPCKPLMMPNAFSPNGDGIDDYFMILNPNDYYRLVSFDIFDRWGQLVFSTNNKNGQGWDGTYAGVAQPTADYFYTVTAECGGGKQIHLKGDLTLIR